MPLAMVHLRVAQKLLNTMEIKKPEMFYLGTISPDAIHERGNITRDDKRVTHLYHIKREIWRDNVIDFIKTNIDSRNNNFYIGYGVHILTDIYWLDTLFMNFVQKAFEDSLTKIKQDDAYYHDLSVLDMKILEEYSMMDNILSIINKAYAPDNCELIGAREIDKWKNQIINWNEIAKINHERPLYFFNYNMLTDFIDDVTKHILSILQIE